MDNEKIMMEMLVRMDEKLDALDNKVGTLDKKVNEIDNKVGTLDKKVNEIDNKVDKLDKRVNVLDDKGTSIQLEIREGFAKVNESLGGIRQQFEESAKHRIEVEEEYATDIKYLTRKVQEFDRFKTLYTPDN